MANEAEASAGTIMQLACPECGGHCRINDMKSDEDGSPVSVDMDCPVCGHINVRKEATGLWSAGDECIPYNPWAHGNALTLIHRFDPSAFDSPEEAVNAEMSLYKTAFGEYMEAEFFSGARSLMPAMKRTWERAVSMDVKDARSDYAMFLMTEVPSAEGDDLASILARISSLISESDVSCCTRIAKALSHMVASYPYMEKYLAQAEERIASILEEQRASDIGAYVGNVYTVSGAYSAMGRDEDAERISRELMSHLRSLPADTPDLEDYMVTAYLCILDYLGTSELRDAMDFMNEVGDRNRESFILTAIRYAVGTWADGDADDILAVVDRAIRYSVDGKIMAPALPTLYTLRYQATGDRRDAMDAAIAALDVLPQDPNAGRTVRYILGDDGIPGKDKAVILREMRKRNISEEDLGSE